MKNHKIIIAALLTVAMSSAHAAETLIDFEDDVFKAALSTASFSYENVTFSGIGRDSLASNFKFTDRRTSFNSDTSGYFLRTGATNFETLKFSFATAVSDFSFNLGENNNNWKLEAFDETGGSISSLFIEKKTNPVNNEGKFFGISSEFANISYVTLTDLEQGAFNGLIEDSITVDNVKFNTQVTSPIPEPSTYLLMMGGLGMVGFMAYRRRKQTA